MRIRDEHKRQAILQRAAKLFATQPFHKVRLDDVATAAGVGKGTLYIYFKSKEDLYLTLLYEGFSAVVERLLESASNPCDSAWARLERIVQGLVEFAFQNPQMWELMRVVGPLSRRTSGWPAKRQQLLDLIRDTLRQGNASGELNDPQPELTALFLPGLVRSAMLHGPRELDRQRLSSQILHLLRQGILIRKGS